MNPRRLLLLLGSLTFVLVLALSNTPLTHPANLLLAQETPTPIPIYVPYVAQYGWINQTASGQITQNETWRDDILITGDVTIQRGIALTIEPGTTTTRRRARPTWSLY
jgi:hypothetical protein